MWQPLMIPMAVMSLAADSPLPNMGQVGTAAHGLNDSQTAMYFMAVLLVALLIERGLTGWRSSATANRLATSIDKLREVIGSGDAQAMANMAVILRVLTEIEGDLALAKDDRATIKAELQKRQAETGK